MSQAVYVTFRICLAFFAVLEDLMSTFNNINYQVAFYLLLIFLK